MMSFNIFPSAYLSFNFMLITIDKCTERLPYVKAPWSSSGRANQLTLWKTGKNIKKNEAEKVLNCNKEKFKDCQLGSTQETDRPSSEFNYWFLITL